MGRYRTDLATAALRVRPGDVEVSERDKTQIRRSGKIGAYVVIDNTAFLREIRIGKSDGRRVEILAGLSIGDEVVVEGQFALRDGARVEVERYGGS